MMDGTGHDVLGGGQPVGVEDDPGVDRPGLEAGLHAPVPPPPGTCLPRTAEPTPDRFLQHYRRHVADHRRAHDLTHRPASQALAWTLPSPMDSWSAISRTK